MSSLQPSLLPHATRELAEFAATIRFEQIPAEVIERIKLSLIDGLGVCLQGSTLPWTRIVQDLVSEEGGKPVASVWGRGQRIRMLDLGRDEEVVVLGAEPDGSLRVRLADGSERVTTTGELIL